MQGAWRGLTRASLALCALCWGVSACELAPTPQSPSSSQAQRPARLQAITYAPRLDTPESEGAGLIIATDVAFYEGVWGEGRVLWVDAQTGAVLGAHYSAQPNPQALTLLGEPPQALLVVEGGALELGEEPSSAHAALTLHPLHAPFTQTQRVQLISNPLTQGYPINALSLTDGEEEVEETGEEISGALYLSSGISGLVWRLSDLWSAPTQPALSPFSTTPLRYAPEETLSLGSLAKWRGRVVVVDFNSDRLFIIDEGALAPCAPHLGRFEGVMEGAQTPRVEGDSLWLTFGLSGELVSFDLSELNLSDPQCALTRQPLTPALGAVPNHLTLGGGSLYVVHSGEQDVWRYSQARGAREARLELPPNTHPWAATLTPNERLIVTGWLSGALHELNATGEQGSSNLLTPPELLSAPSPARCERPREWEGEGGVELPVEGLVLSWSDVSDASVGRSAEPSAPASLLQGAPQLALEFSAGEGEVLVEAQRSEGGPWEALITLTLSPREALNLTSPAHPKLLSAEGLVLTPAEGSAPQALNPCDVFQPAPHRARVRLDVMSDAAPSPLPPHILPPHNPPSPQLWLSGDAQAGRHPLHALRLTPISSPLPTSEVTRVHISEVVYRAW